MIYFHTMHLKTLSFFTGAHFVNYCLCLLYQNGLDGPVGRDVASSMSKAVRPCTGWLRGWSSSGYSSAEEISEPGHCGQTCPKYLGGLREAAPPCETVQTIWFSVPVQNPFVRQVFSSIVDAPAARTFLKQFPWIPRYLEDSSVPRCSLVLSRKLWSKKSNIQNLKGNYVICFSSTSSFVYSWWVVMWVNKVSKFSHFFLSCVLSKIYKWT